MILVSDWRWPLTWKVRANVPPPFPLWILWHHACLLPKVNA